MTSQDTTQAGGWVEEAMALVDAIAYASDMADEAKHRDRLRFVFQCVYEKMAAAEGMREALEGLLRVADEWQVGLTARRQARAALSAYNQLKKG